MQKDSVHFSTSGHTMYNQSVTQESAIKSFHCSHCTLILKSKVYLFEHLTMVHGIDIDTALRDAGLKSSETNKANTDNKSSNPGNIFLCQHCDFKACSQDVLNDHEKLCSKKLVNHNGTEILETKTIVIPTNQHKEGAVKSTSKATCALNSSKDLKTYKRPLQTITKYFAPTSGSNGKTSVKLSESPVVLDNNKATILLQESPSSSSPNSSGVFKVTAKSMIDISKDVPERFLRYDHLLISDLRPEKSREKFKETPPNNTGKRTNSEISESCAAKKAKSDKEKKELPEKANSRKQQSSRNTEFSFEFSEDEEEKMANLVNGCTESPKEYFCKHCDYSDVGIRNMSTHYQSDHPYIRYNAVYIQDQSDQSATFRCLECPIEFSSVANLKRHYTENHPEALEVFTMHLHELSLVFKCFVCPYTSKELKALKDHYKEKHPKHKVDNSLLYCRYSATRCQEGSSQLNTCEKVHSPERSDSLENANTQYEEVKNAPSTQHPTSNTADVILYQCNNCNFSHKSIVVMHVHYQKSHPGEAVTIDHIKQSAHVTSHTTSQMTPEKSETVIEDSAPQKNISESSKKAKDKAELSQQKKHTRNASLTKCNREMDSSPNKMFYCQFCSYSSTNIRSVVAHHNIKHFVHGLTDTEEILLYSATVQKKIPQNETEASARTASSDSKTSKQVEVCGEKKTQYEVDNVADASVVGSNPYACAENLFYCQKCNIGNPTVKGILNHQAKVHQRINSSRECIIEHTALVRDEIEKSKSHTKELAFSTHLPPPLMNEGDEDRLFCHFCNYRHNSMTQVMKHYLKRHNGVEVKVEQIHLHTALVLKKTQGTHLKTTANQEVSHVSLGKKGNKKKKTKKHAKCLSVSASPSATQTQRTLGCHRCTYSTQYVYLLRRHMWKIHQANRSVNDVLRVCFKQGMLQSGYHCDLCVFSHKNAEAVHMHYQEQHPTRRLSLEYVSAQLYVGPDTSSCKGKKPQIKHTGGISDGDGTDSGLLSERIAQNDIKRYSCRACSFKGSSLSSITQHYRAVHPWSVKDDGSVLNVITSKKPSANSHVEDYNQVSGSFDSYQVPLEFDKSVGSHEATASPTMLKCLYCPARFQTHRGLSTHCGMKHPGAVPENSDEQQEQMETSVHVFKCRYCTYVNTNHKGVLTHCQMRHPASISRADSLHVDETHIQSWDNSLKRKGPGGSLGLRGFMCKTCPQICATEESLNKHCENDHNETVPNTLKPAAQPSTVSKIHQSNTHSTLGSISKASLSLKRMYAVIKCQHCSYSCTTKFALSRHLHVHHRNASVSKVKDRVYKCVLCPSSYSWKKRLAHHYTNKHGKEAFLKYYAPVYKLVPEKSELSSTVSPLTQQPGNTEECKSSIVTEENKILVYKCPSCPYVNASYHGTLTHCQMMHPDVVARADELKTDEILVTNLVRCKMGKASNQRGYMCQKCPQIHASLVKLKIHCERDHSQAEPSASEHSAETETEKEPDHSSQGSVSEAASLKSQTSADITESDRSHTQHSLSTHCGKKHQEAVTENLDGQQEQVQIQARVHVFKCPYCTYVNTNYHGVLTHCQMRHPASISRADSLHLETHLYSWDDCLQKKDPGGSLKVRGFMCKTCPQICATQESLNKHCENDHNETVPNTLKPAAQPSTESKIHQSNTHSTLGSVSKASLSCKKIYAVIKCQHCSYSCSTKIALSRHLRFHHSSASVSKVKDCVYKCVLCPSSYFWKKRLGHHYTKKHGKEAFLKYYVPVYKLVPEKSELSSTVSPLTQQPGNTEECKSSIVTEENKILVYKCPSCPYVNATYHGTLTHCQMMHPDVVARADELKTDEILVTNLVRCKMGKASNQRGYMCQKCPQIHASLVKLKIHCERDHSQAEPSASEHSTETETEKEPDHSSQGSVSEAASLKSQTSADITESDRSQQPGSPETFQESEPNTELLYMCCLCNYTGVCRKYLYCHYKNTHKLDAFSTYKMLEKYNKRKRKFSNLPKPAFEDSPHVKCKKCPDVMFDSSQLLIAHYSTFHSSDCKLDFIVLSQGSKKKSTGLYKCAHCRKQLNGIKKLHHHLDHHRAMNVEAAETKESLVITTTPEATSTEMCRQDELPVFETVEELTQWNVTPVETFTLPTSPLSSPSKFTDLEQPELKSRGDKHTCKQCGRAFMSLKGLRSHERSHAALAAIKKLDNLQTLAVKHNINKYVIYKSGTLRPFLCSFCSYRTTVLGLWRSHFMRKHQDVIMDPVEPDDEDEENALRANKDPPILSNENNYLPESDEEPEIAKSSLYLEPPDVQRQLNHYNLMAQTGVSSKANLQDTDLPENSLLNCEFCNFSTGHLSSMRRHYINRHGKKIHRCKDCDFFTGLRKTLDMHVQTGHSTFQSEPTYQRDLRCPFCLYQTKNKNNMIDHIILHREERVVPIEVRRSKLSRYLQGVIFRCHKCTFSSGSAENLSSHMTKHDDIKPYKCRLCYFDCTLLSDLEAHLSDKHQVVRNHELVGQVSLDQLEARDGRIPEVQQEPLKNVEHHNNESENVETEEFVKDGNEVLCETQSESQAENNITGRKQTEIVFSPDTARGQRIGDKVEQNTGEGNNAGIQFEDCSGPERERQTNENKKEEEAEGSSTKCGKSESEKTGPHKLNIEAFKQRMLNIHKKAHQDRTAKIEQNTETEFKVNSEEKKNNIRGQEGFKIEGHLPNCAQHHISHKESLGISFTNCKEEQVHSQKNSDEVTDPYGEMPVLENEYLKKETQTLGCCKEEEEDHHPEQKQEEEEDHHPEQKQEEEDKVVTEGSEDELDRIKETDSPHAHKSAFTATSAASEVLCPSVADQKLYTCEFCGRNLMNSSELKRHIMRHGI